MKKTINFTAIAISLVIGIVLSMTSIIVASATHFCEPQNELERVAERISTYTPEYASAIEQIAQERGVEPWKVTFYPKKQYSVMVEEPDYVGAGKKSVEVWYLCVDGMEEPVYATERYLEDNNYFDLTSKDIHSAINKTVGGYKAEELMIMFDDWMEAVANSDEVYFIYYK